MESSGKEGFPLRKSYLWAMSRAIFGECNRIIVAFSAACWASFVTDVNEIPLCPFGREVILKV